MGIESPTNEQLRQEIQGLRARLEELERRQAAWRGQVETLQADAESLSAAFEHAGVGVAHVGLDGRFLHVNRRLCDLVGYDRDALQGLTFQDVTHPSDLDLDLDLMRRLLAGDVPSYTLEKRYRHRDGSLVWVNLTALLVRDAAGGPRYFIAMMEDITARKRTEERLLAEATFRQAVESSIPAGVAAVDARGRQNYVNAAFCRLVGWTASELVGASPPFVYWPPEEHEAIRAALQATVRGEAPAGGLQLRFLRRGGERFDALVQIAPLRDEAGTPTGWLASVSDVTALRRAEQEAREASAACEEALQMHRHVEGQLASLLEASGSLTEAPALPTVLAGVVDLARRLLPADAHAVWRFDEAAGLWGIAAAHGLSDAYRQTTIERTLDTPRLPNGPVMAEDVFQAGMLDARRRLYEAEGIRSLLAVPLRIHGEPCGTLVFYYRTPHRFIEAEVRVATGLGNLAAAVIGAADLYEAQSKARAEAEAAQRRLAFIAEASGAIASTLHEEVALQSIACLVVPYLADWCVIDLLKEDGSVQRLVGRHSDPAREGLLYELLKHNPHRPEATCGVPEVFRNGKPEVRNAIDAGWLDAASVSPEHADVLRRLGLGSYLTVPLVARQRTLGAISLVSLAPDRYDPDDVVLAEDLARRVALAVDNARLYRQARDSDRRKDEFLAMLAHELRNPLAPVRNALHLLRRRPAPSPAEAAAQDMMERQVRNMTRLIDDLLDVSRITRGKIELRKEPLDLRDVVRRAAESSRTLIESRGHALTVALPDEPLPLEADPTRLEQVLTNLLNNAAKFTEPGGRIAVDVVRVAGEATVCVRDTGMGMTPEVLARAFDLFVQADRSLDRTQGGLGIGLTLVRSLVELHDGQVNARSDGPNLGSEFTVRLPLRPDARGNGALQANPASPAAPPARRILVVDDNRDAADSLAALLRLTGHDVRVVYDGRAALTASDAHRPDVVLLDIGLPGLNGYEVARELRRRPELARCLIVAISGYGQEEDRARAREAGCDTHLIKPVEPDAVQALLMSAIRPDVTS